MDPNPNEPMKQIPVGKDLLALVDDEDFEAVSKYSWTKQKDRQTFYAVSCLPRLPNGHRPRVSMHGLIGKLMGIVGMIDHKDRNGLNNRRDNLRPCSHSQNSANRISPGGRSRFKGVSVSSANRWAATITINRKQKWLGSYLTEIEAAIAYDAAAKESFGEYARLNFPEQDATTGA